MSKVEDIIHQSRRTGNTTWILKSAVNNPNCVIVVNNQRYAKDLEHLYNNMLLLSPWYKRVYWSFFGRGVPQFVSISSDFRGYNKPIIFDNSSLI